ncbi:hypothetical protein SAMD00019534_077750 [Acytostelium subglobosum LB1]|uniref:hypothetical protein n=1 Tax=Acytostelium subglobosum LB1 TaxID=1410327 RepID=UPI0006448CAC|nr:hypothetical protein SAMD00019534_077750 [Acytostelium subglobosum LB1]GAM24600.1 hypothetical protein SAMD00019534_077750 [Acytostelium subglobosum LB1]|eukprot:XP_012752269.1 hypothetical protein SAMD00019534_077750 [Acytostelium subglobosum LB1]
MWCVVGVGIVGDGVGVGVGVVVVIVGVGVGVSVVGVGIGVGVVGVCVVHDVLAVDCYRLGVGVASFVVVEEDQLVENEQD